MKFKRAPYEVEKDKSYFWGSCGKSKKQPFCGGSRAGSYFKPSKYVAEKTENKYFCPCKKTKNKPLCDRSHNRIEMSIVDGDHFYTTVQRCYQERRAFKITRVLRKVR